MNSEKIIAEVKKAPDGREKWRVLYVSNKEELELLNDACREEWVITSSVANYTGGVFYTIKRHG